MQLYLSGHPDNERLLTLIKEALTQHGLQDSVTLQAFTHAETETQQDLSSLIRPSGRNGVTRSKWVRHGGCCTAGTGGRNPDGQPKS